MGPNFIIIGATKSGTTSLYKYLAQHPEIFMSDIKEPHYFMYRGEKLDFKGPGDLEIAEQMIVNSREKYLSLFKNTDHIKIRGEASAMYIYSHKAAANIYEYNPNIKLLAILRDPVERAFSSYMHLRRDGRETVEKFWDALQLEDKRIKENWMPLWYYKDLGFYHHQLKKYAKFFKDKQLKVINFHDFKRDPHLVLNEIFEWLGVSKEYTPKNLPRYNKSGLPKSQWLHNILRKGTVFNPFVKKIIPEPLLVRIKNYLLNKNIQKTETIDHKSREFLDNLYREDLYQLKENFHIDLLCESNE